MYQSTVSRAIREVTPLCGAGSPFLSLRRVAFACWMELFQVVGDSKAHWNAARFAGRRSRCEAPE